MNTTRIGTLVIVNPAAARTRRLWRELRQELAARGVGCHEYMTTRPGDATARTRHALQRENYRTIVAAGGDGTISEVAAGFFTTFETDAPPRPVNPRAALALLPAGTGDDFARGLAGGTRAPLQHWIERLAHYSHAAPEDHTTRRVDVLDGRASIARTPRIDSAQTLDGEVCTQRFICLNAATLGIGAEVATSVARQGRFVRRAGGEIRFAFAALPAIARWHARAVLITVDDAPPFTSLTNLLAVMNGRFAGGGMMFAPAAEVDDGKLEVVSTNRLTRGVLLRELARIHRGGHINNPAVRITSGTHVRIETDTANALFIEADGDVRGTTPVEFRVMRGVLRVVV